MTDNADQIIKINQVEACDQCCACPAQYGAADKKGSNTPFLYKSCADKSQPFGYENSDLKKLYLSKYDLQCRMYTPVMSQDQLLKGGYQNFN
jgi:hypothetical protein